MDSIFAKHRIWISRIIAVAFILLIALTQSTHTGKSLAGYLSLLGLILVGLAVAGRLWCSLYIAGYKNQQLITVGPYSMTRNPLYFFSFLGFTGIGFATQSLTIGIGTAVIFLLFYPYIIRHEESFLQNEFGEAFTKYLQTTPRFWPKPSLLTEPGSYQVNPRTFRREVGDVLGFILALGIVQLILSLHTSGVINPVLALP